jgi:hypothetical protein
MTARRRFDADRIGRLATTKFSIKINDVPILMVRQKGRWDCGI